MHSEKCHEGISVQNYIVTGKKDTGCKATTLSSTLTLDNSQHAQEACKLPQDSA